jgi:curved DNA-binding protein CbpA
VIDPDLDPYKTLQVDPEAEDEVIAAAYRRLARKYHPDTAEDPAAAVAASERMTALNAAWELIGDPERRVVFDRRRAVRAALSRRASDDLAETARPPSPDVVSRDWTSGRSPTGSGYDPSMRRADADGAAGPAPGNPTGSVLTFGRYAGWSLGEISRRDLEYIEWLDRMPIGRPYRDEIDAILRSSGRRRSAEAESIDRRGLFRRR